MDYGPRDFSITSRSRDIETPESRGIKGRKIFQDDSCVCSEGHRATESVRLGQVVRTHENTA
jgi:hypothetical protein